MKKNIEEEIKINDEKDKIKDNEVLLDSKNENNKYILSTEQKEKFKNILIETFNKENMYLF